MLKKILICTVTLLILYLSLTLFITLYSIRPCQSTYDFPPENEFEQVHLQNERGENLIGWASTTEFSQSVLLLHGIRSHSQSMLERAHFFRDSLQYNVILFDQRAHGMSDGSYSSAGLFESLDLPLFERYIKKRYGTSMGVLGVSMGGAATLLALDSIAPDFLILEMVYPTLDEAIVNRLKKRLGPFSSFIQFGISVILKSRYHMNPSEVRPIEMVDTYTNPVLIISGESDVRTTSAETKRLFETFPKREKELYFIKGAAHEDLYQFDEKQYRAVVKKFLKK